MWNRMWCVSDKSTKNEKRINHSNIVFNILVFLFVFVCVLHVFDEKKRILIKENQTLFKL